MTGCDFDNKVITFESVLWKEKSRASEQELADDVVGRKSVPVAKPAEELEKMPNVPTNTSKTKTINFDFLIGADGTYSSVRQSMMRKLEVDFSQFYCNALWCDFIFPPDKAGNYRMSSKCLHVWPADENIVMAQPDFVSCLSLQSSSHVPLLTPSRTDPSAPAWSATLSECAISKRIPSNLQNGLHLNSLESCLTFCLQRKQRRNS